jgi:hypothetical protein
LRTYFDERGFLPAGIHQKTWDWFNIIELDEWRRHLLLTARNFCRDELTCFYPLNGCLYLVGSFFSDKERPNDLEILLHFPSDIETIEQYRKMISITMLHDKIETDIHLDVWITTPSITPHDFVKWFQYVGEKSAIIKNISEKDKRGIIEVTQWQHGLI